MRTIRVLRATIVRFLGRIRYKVERIALGVIELDAKRPKAETLIRVVRLPRDPEHAGYTEGVRRITRR